MLWTQTDRSLCALAQMAPRGQAALLSGLGHALTQATGRQPDDLCHRKGTSHLPDHGRGRRRLTKPKSFRPGRVLQNVQTPAADRRSAPPWPLAHRYKLEQSGGPVILCIGTTPAAQRVMTFRKLTIDAVNRAVTTLDGVAGKSVNVAKVLKALGEHPVATGFLGGDRGEWLRAVLEAQGIELEFVNVAPRTRQCTTLIDASTDTHTELVEESQPVAPADYEELMRIIQIG